MKLLIDMQGAQGESRFRGIGRYVIDITKALIESRGEHEVMLLLNGHMREHIEDIRYYFSGILPSASIVNWEAPGPLDYKDEVNAWRLTAAGVMREAAIDLINPDILFIPSMFEGYNDSSVLSVPTKERRYKIATTLHDLIPLIGSEVYLEPYPSYSRFYRSKLEYLKKSDALLAISESAKAEAVEWVNYDPSRICVTHEGVKDEFKVEKYSESIISRFKNHFHIDRKFILYSGAADQRKNHLRLIAAYAALPIEVRKEFQLVFAGNISIDYKNKFNQYAKLKGLAQTDLVLTELVSDVDMVKFYNLAHLFVFPSWHEGFGLPALEAMACGCPVIAANTSSLPEIVANTEALFNPFDIEDITRSLQRALKDEPWRRKLIAHSLRRSKAYSWRNSATIAWNFFESMAPDHGLVSTDPLQTTLVSVAECVPSGVSEGTLIEYSRLMSAMAPASGKPTMYVDISELCQRDAKTGVQRVVRSLLIELLIRNDLPYNIRPVFGTYDLDYGYRYANSYMRKFCESIPDLQPLIASFKDSDSVISVKAGDAFFGLDLQHDVVIRHAPLLQEFRRQGVRVTFLMHDLLPVLMPEVFHGEMYRVHSEWMNVLAHNDGVVCVSRTVADEYLQWLDIFGPLHGRKVGVGWSHNGFDISRSNPSKGMPEDAQSAIARMRSTLTFISVGTIEPRKGYMQVLLAFERLWAAGVDVNLVIIGKRGWDVDLLTEMLQVHSENGKRLFWLNGVSDEYLEEIYKASSCLIAASLGEGFGLPLIEAADKDLPILSRDIPVFREVAGGHAVYFKGEEPEDLERGVLEWIKMHDKGLIPNSGLISRITWKDSCDSLIDNIINNHWYEEWKPVDVKRFRASDPRYFSGTGRRSGSGLQTDGGKGYLFYGTYSSLAAGRYKIKAAGRLLTGANAYVDVASEQGTKILQIGMIEAMDNPFLLTSFEIEVNQDCDDAEFRVWVEPNSDLWFSHIDVEQLE